MLSAGIVGLPNVGKSTLFNAVTRTRKAQAANYPFCTIEPNQGIVVVPDSRVETLAKMSKSVRTVPAAIEFVDIAGLVAGASQGEGLGNQFLSHIREVDAIAHVVRAFDNADIVHVTGRIDPLSDIDTIDTELGLADLATLEKGIDRQAKAARSGEKDVLRKKTLFDRVKQELNAGRPVRAMKLSEEERRDLRALHLLTA